MEQQNPPASTTLPSQPQPHPQPQPVTPSPSASQLAQQQVLPSPRRQPPASAPNPTTLPPASPATSNSHVQISSARPSPQAFSRPAWHHPHFAPSSPAPAASSIQPRVTGPTGGMSIGVPAASHPLSSPSSFPQQHARPSESPSPQTKPGVPQGMVAGNSSAQIRPGSVPAHLARPSQSLPRPVSAISSQPAASQNFQSHGFMRSPSPLPSTSSVMTPSRNPPPMQQPWMASQTPGKPPLPSSSMRPQAPLSIRSIHPSQQQLSQSHQILTSHNPHEHNPHQFQSSKSTTQQFQQVRVQPSALKPLNKVVDESCTRIISKRTINELVSQIDPLEKLDPEVEDILIDIAEDFFDSITSFGCSLAKHRKSEKLESKDILLHLERNWNITLPGFIGDEIKTYKKPVTSDVHKERLSIVKKSLMMSDSGAGKNATGQTGSAGKNNHGKLAAGSVLS